MKSLGTMLCPKHPWEQEVKSRNPDPINGIVHVHLNCGCTLEIEDESLKDRHTDVGIRVGDIVRWNSELFVVRSVKRDSSLWWATIENTRGDDEVLVEWLEYLGVDHLTGLSRKEATANPAKYFPKRDNPTAPIAHREPKKQKFSWEEDNDHHKSWHKSEKKDTPKPRKQDSISTGALIENEVKELKKEDEPATPKYSWEEDYSYRDGSREVGETRPLKPQAKTKDVELTKLPKRKGDW